jgi:hypothetical protein
MADVTLLLDEDVRITLGKILRQRGFDVKNNTLWLND